MDGRRRGGSYTNNVGERTVVSLPPDLFMSLAGDDPRNRSDSLNIRVARMVERKIIQP